MTWDKLLPPSLATNSGGGEWGTGSTSSVESWEQIERKLSLPSVTALPRTLSLQTASEDSVFRSASQGSQKRSSEESTCGTGALGNTLCAKRLRSSTD